jgi:nuclear pore complex protein Nup160
VSGVAYLLRIRNVSAYGSCSVLPEDEIIELNVHDYVPNNAALTAVTATSRCLVIGTSDGSVFCFQLGVLDAGAIGFVHELRDEAGIGRLWGLISRGKMVGTVQDLVISELYGKKFVFALHLDGTLRIWDLVSHSRVFSHNMGVMLMAGASFLRLWVGQSDPNSSIIPLAILYRHTSDENMEMISLHSILYNFGDRIFSMEPPVQNIPLEEGRCLDVKLMSDKIWILKENELVSHLLATNIDEYVTFSNLLYYAALLNIFS